MSQTHDQPEANKRAAHRVYDVWDGGDIDDLDDLEAERTRGHQELWHRPLWKSVVTGTGRNLRELTQDDPHPDAGNHRTKQPASALSQRLEGNPVDHDPDDPRAHHTDQRTDDERQFEAANHEQCEQRSPGSERAVGDVQHAQDRKDQPEPHGEERVGRSQGQSIDELLKEELHPLLPTDPKAQQPGTAATRSLPAVDTSTVPTKRLVILDDHTLSRSRAPVNAAAPTALTCPA